MSSCNLKICDGISVHFSYDEETPSNSHLYLAATEAEAAAEEGTGHPGEEAGEAGETGENHGRDEVNGTDVKPNIDTTREIDEEDFYE